MRLVGKLGVLAAIVTVSMDVHAVEMREDLSFISGRYASADNCKKLQAVDRKGGHQRLMITFGISRPKGSVMVGKRLAAFTWFFKNVAPQRLKAFALRAPIPAWTGNILSCMKAKRPILI